MEDKALSTAIQAVAILIGGVIAYFIVKSIISGVQEKKDIASGEQLAGTPEMKSNAIATVAKTIPKKDLSQVKNQLDNFDVKVPADIIYNGKGYLWDDEKSAYNGFAMLKNKAQLAMLGLYFEMLYKVNLFQYINSYMNPSELTQVNAIVSKLPAY